MKLFHKLTSIHSELFWLRLPTEDTCFAALQIGRFYNNNIKDEINPS